MSFLWCFFCLFDSHMRHARPLGKFPNSILGEEKTEIWADNIFFSEMAIWTILHYVGAIHLTGLWTGRHERSEALLLVFSCWLDKNTN